jgi:hypothetical protein
MTTANSLQTPPPANGQHQPAPPSDIFDSDDYGQQAGTPEFHPNPAPAAAATQPAPAPTPAPQTPPAPKHPAWLTSKAEALGLHPLLVERLDTGELSQVVTESLHRQLAERADRSRTETVQGQQGQAAAAATPAQPQAPPAFEWGEFEDEDPRTGAKEKRKYTDEDIAAPIAHHIKKLYEKVSRVEELEKYIATMQKQVVESAEARREREFDAAFSKFPALYGQGGYAAVKDNTEFLTRRKAAYQMAKAMIQSAPPELAAQLTVESVVTNLTRTMFGQAPVAAAATPAPQPNHPGNGYANGHVAQPTARQPGARQPGRAAAIDAVSDLWRQQQAQAPTPAGDYTTLDEFLE